MPHFGGVGFPSLNKNNMKKTIALVLLGLVAVGGIIFFQESTSTYQKEVVEKIIEVDNTPAELKDCEECLQAAREMQRKLELQAELAQLEADLKAENERHDQVSKELGDEITRVEKELGTY